MEAKPAKVYFSTFRTTLNENLLMKLRRLITTAGIKNIDFTKLNKAAVLPSVTQSDLLNLWIDIPPIALQDEFAKFYNLVEYIKQQILDMTEKVTKMRENAIIEALSVKEEN